MDTLDLKEALVNFGQIPKHPRWIASFLRGGREGLYKQATVDSLMSIRRASPISKLTDLETIPLTTPIGQMGGTQELLYPLVRFLRPKAIVETGVYRGLSTAFMLAAVADNGMGKVYSVDLPSASYYNPGTKEYDRTVLRGHETPGFAIPVELKDNWTLVVGPSKQVLPPLLDKLGQIDLFVHDSEHTYDCMWWEFTEAFAHIKPGGVLASDDVEKNSAFRDFVAAKGLAWSTTREGRLGIALKGMPIK